jgi:hypothetical protein
MPLQVNDILNGSFGIVALGFCIYAAILIISKYFEYKKIEFLLMGLCAIILATPWAPHSVSFIYALATGSDQGILPEIYFIIGNVFVPVGILLWLWAFTELTYKKYQKNLLIFGICYLILFETLFFSMLFIDPLLIGELQPPVHVKYNIGLICLLLSGVIIVSVTSYFFIRESLRSDNPEIRLRGKFILSGIITLFIGAIMEGFLSLITIFLVISRILLIICGALFYIGFIPPEFIRKRLLKSE